MGTVIKSSTSITKVVAVFFISYFAACFAWAHGGWYGVFAIFLGSAYLCATLPALAFAKYLLVKHGPSAVSDRVRIPYVVMVIILFGQLLLVPVLTDGPVGGGYWSIVSGLHRAPESAKSTNIAAGFFLISNLAFILSLIAMYVLLILDWRTARKS